MSKIITEQQAIAFAQHVQQQDIRGYFDAVAATLAETGSGQLTAQQLNDEANQLVYANAMSVSMHQIFTLAGNQRLTEIAETLTELSPADDEERELAESTFDYVTSIQQSAQPNLPKDIDVKGLYIALVECLMEYPMLFNDQHEIALTQMSNAIALLGLPPLPHYTGDVAQDSDLYLQALQALPEDAPAPAAAAATHAYDDWFKNPDTDHPKLVM